MAERCFSYDTDFPAPEMVSEVANVLARQVDKSVWDKIIETYKSVLSFCEVTLVAHDEDKFLGIRKLVDEIKTSEFAYTSTTPPQSIENAVSLINFCKAVAECGNKLIDESKDHYSYHSIIKTAPDCKPSLRAVYDSVSPPSPTPAPALTLPTPSPSPSPSYRVPESPPVGFSPQTERLVKALLNQMKLFVLKASDSENDVNNKIRIFFDNALRNMILYLREETASHYEKLEEANEDGDAIPNLFSNGSGSSKTKASATVKTAILSAMRSALSSSTTGDSTNINVPYPSPSSSFDPVSSVAADGASGSAGTNVPLSPTFFPHPPTSSRRSVSVSEEEITAPVVVKRHQEHYNHNQQQRKYCRVMPHQSGVAKKANSRCDIVGLFQNMHQHVSVPFGNTGTAPAEIKDWQVSETLTNMGTNKINVDLDDYVIPAPSCVGQDGKPGVLGGIRPNNRKTYNRTSPTPFEQYVIDLVFKFFAPGKKTCDGRVLDNMFSSGYQKACDKLRRPDMYRHDSLAKTMRTTIVKNIGTSEFLVSAYDNTVRDEHRSDLMKSIFYAPSDAAAAVANAAATATMGLAPTSAQTARVTLNQLVYMGTDVILALAHGCMNYVFDGTVIGPHDCRMPLDLYIQVATAIKYGKLFDNWSMPGQAGYSFVCETGTEKEMSNAYAKHLVRLGMQTWGKLNEDQMVYPYVFLNHTTEGENVLFPSLCYYDGTTYHGHVKTESTHVRTTTYFGSSKGDNNNDSPQVVYVNLEDSSSEDEADDATMGTKAPTSTSTTSGAPTPDPAAVIAHPASPKRKASASASVAEAEAEIVSKKKQKTVVQQGEEDAAPSTSEYDGPLFTDRLADIKKRKEEGKKREKVASKEEKRKKKELAKEKRKKEKQEKRKKKEEKAAAAAEALALKKKEEKEKATAAAAAEALALKKKEEKEKAAAAAAAEALKKKEEKEKAAAAAAAEALKKRKRRQQPQPQLRHSRRKKVASAAAQEAEETKKKEEENELAINIRLSPIIDDFAIEEEEFNDVDIFPEAIANIVMSDEEEVAPAPVPVPAPTPDVAVPRTPINVAGKRILSIVDTGHEEDPEPMTPDRVRRYTKRVKKPSSGSASNSYDSRGAEQGNCSPRVKKLKKRRIGGNASIPASTPIPSSAPAPAAVAVPTAGEESESYQDEVASILENNDFSSESLLSTTRRRPSHSNQSRSRSRSRGDRSKRSHSKHHGCNRSRSQDRDRAHDGRRNFYSNGRRHCVYERRNSSWKYGSDGGDYHQRYHHPIRYEGIKKKARVDYGQQHPPSPHVSHPFLLHHHSQQQRQRQQQQQHWYQQERRPLLYQEQYGSSTYHH